MFCEVKNANMLKSSEWGLERSEPQGNGLLVAIYENRIFVAVGVLPLELLAYQVSMVCTAKRPR